MPVGGSIREAVTLEFYAGGRSVLAAGNHPYIDFRCWPFSIGVAEEPTVVDGVMRPRFDRDLDESSGGDFLAGFFHRLMLAQPDAMMHGVLAFSAKFALRVAYQVSSRRGPGAGPHCIAGGGNGQASTLSRYHLRSGGSFDDISANPESAQAGESSFEPQLALVHALNCFSKQLTEEFGRESGYIACDTLVIRDENAVLRVPAYPMER